MTKENNSFDKNSIDRIHGLFVMKSLCECRHEDVLGKINKDFPDFLKGARPATFFSVMSCVLDNFIIQFCNEEVSASLPDRGCLNDILDDIVSDVANSHPDKPDIIVPLNYVQKMLKEKFKFRIDDYIAATMIQTFSVELFSIFEYWMTRLYEQLGKEKRHTKKRNEIKNILKNKLKEINAKEVDDITSEIISKTCNYLSSSEKIQQVLKHFFEQNTDLKEKKKRFKEVVEFCRDMRNTIHNLGIHLGEDKEIKTLDGAKMVLKKEKFGRSDDYVDGNMSLYRELINIYWHIIERFKITNPEALIINNKGAIG